MLRRQAAQWLARLQSRRDPDVERKFRKWHDADPRHAEAFDRIQRSYEQAGLLRHSPPAGSGQPGTAIREAESIPRPALAAAVALVILVPVGAVLFHRDGWSAGGTKAVMLMTRVGEIKQVRLEDGSKVTLDTSTKVEVEIGRSRRTAHLRYGRARFQIAPSGPPFVVETPASSVTTRDAVFDVEQGAADRIQVLAGSAEVRRSDHGDTGRVTLGAQEAVTVTSGGTEQRALAGVRGPDWTHGMLQFDGTPLVAAVALANRYSERHILLAGDLATLKVTGAFRAGDTFSLAKALAAAFSLSLEQRPDGDLVLSRMSTDSALKKRGG